MTEDYAAIRAAALSAPRARKPRGCTERDIANIRRWRADNPDAVARWDTTYGCVVAFWGQRIYYGTCQACEGLVTARRPMAYHGNTGRWPKNCSDCNARKHAEHNQQATERMRRLRARTEYPFDDPDQHRKREAANRELNRLVEYNAAKHRTETATERFYRLAREMGMRDPE